MTEAERKEKQEVKYRLDMEEQLARDFWFMNIEKPDPWNPEFSWYENCFPMEWNNGWLRPFYNLCRDLLLEVKSDFRWTQLKEKWGMACCYYDGGITPYGEELIHEFEHETKEICEVCGKSGSMRTDGWYKVLCNECYEEVNKR